MRDATVERLAKIISDRNDDGSGEKGFRSRHAFELHLGLAEGWFSLFLVAAVVYSTIWCVQAVGWVEHLNILTLTTALGLIIGVIAAKQQRFSRLPVHLVVLAFGLLLAFWQTAGAFYDGNTAALAHGMQTWFSTVTHGGSGNDDSIFLFFIAALGFILAYTSTWLVYRTRSPWLMIAANAVVLLINLSAAIDGFIIFLVVFLMASLLLLLRFNLYESVRRWQKQGLRYADDIGWDVMQAGALISIGILIFSWLLPAGYTNPAVAQIWSLNSNPWVQLQNTWNRVISVEGGVIPSNRGNFRDTLALGGNPNLNKEIVFTVQSNDGSQYLQSLSYDTYTDRGWVVGPTSTLKANANQPYSSTTQLSHALQQKIKVINPPGEQYPYLFGASQLASTSVRPNLLQSTATGEVVAWLGQDGYLGEGTTYTVISSVSSADEKTLRSVPLPADAPPAPPASMAYDAPVSVNYFNPDIVRINTQLPNNLDPRISDLAKRISAQSPTMYGKAVALEQYLRKNYTYSTNIKRPSGQDGVAWFLFDNPAKNGFCNYYASAMALMARSLGIPARVVAGYTNGDPDQKVSNQRVIRGTDAHSWTQVFFAGYGWINFEPSASFSTFTRPNPSDYSSTGSMSIGGDTTGVTGQGLKDRNRFKLDASDNGGASNAADAQGSLYLRQQVGMALGSLVLLLLFAAIVFGIWWSRLFRRYSLASRLYGRVCILANWAGIELHQSLTPYEYIQELAVVAPNDTDTLERLGDIYVRERWADPESIEHPRRNGELDELPGLWKRLQPHLILYVLRHPHFLRWLPSRVWHFFSAFLERRRARRLSFDEDV